MSVSDLDVRRSAKSWPELHGDEAVERARGMVGVLQARVDADGADIWLPMIGAIEELRRRALP